ncbi:MAG: NAD(P)H-dependent oxidoreductase [Rhodobacteraceae bacterium]|nr:NAD(P)H-dependent oxidoreductase [Paracoccaceae bacterium]
MKLLGISGSLRANSFNTMLLAEAARLFAPSVYTLANLNLPLFNEDIAEKPEAVLKLHAEIAAADAVIIATPEYNKNLSGVLKNALDWISVVRPAAWAGKPVAIMSASSGITGGVRAQYSLRHCMTTFNPRILQAPEVMIGNAAEAFDARGKLGNDRTITLLTKQMEALKAEAFNYMSSA